MATFWRQAGLTYLHFSSICAKITRECLKSELIAVADKGKVVGAASAVKTTIWEGGKPKTVIDPLEGKKKPGIA